MNTPRNPNDPDPLPLKPSGSKARDDQPDFGKVRSEVRSTEAPAAPGPDFSKVRSSVRSTEDVAGGSRYTVEKGDTLSHIAKAHYGKASQWRRIFAANRDLLADPDRIQPGQVLTIPHAPSDAD